VSDEAEIDKNDNVHTTGTEPLADSTITID
jgi:hypothetical protein